MFILFFLVWVALNSRFTLEVAIIGVVISALLYVFCCKFMHYSLERDKLNARRLARLIMILPVLISEIFKSAFALLPYIYSKGKQPESVVARFSPEGIKSDAGRAMLANCITMTPGTITGSLKDGEYLVHCLDESMAQGLDSSSFVRAIERWEGKK